MLQSIFFLTSEVHSNKGSSPILANEQILPTLAKFTNFQNQQLAKNVNIGQFCQHRKNLPILARFANFSEKYWQTANIGFDPLLECIELKLLISI